MKKSPKFSLLMSIGIGIGFTSACGGAPPPKPKAKPPAALANLASERKELLEQYASVAEPLRQKCEFQHGECLMQARDDRYDILGVLVFPECDTKKGNDKLFCEENAAVEQGRGERMVAYYKEHNTCLTRMMQCTAKLVDEQEEAARIELAHQRQTTIEQMTKSEALQVDALTKAKSVDYMRSTLPPNEEGVCRDLPETVECRSQVKAQDEEFKAELLKDDAEYDQAHAAELFQQARTTEAGCPEPELSCLYARARKYGASPETERAFKRNVEIIKQRERLSLQIGEQAASKCENAAVAKYQGDIISAYTTYVHQPVLFFRNKLHKVFLQMHRAEVDCLRAGAKQSAAQAEAAAPNLQAKR